MTALRKYGAIVLVSIFVIGFVFAGTNSCSNNSNNQRVNPSKNSTYEPKFRQDGNGWLVSAAAGDTLHVLDLEYANTPDRIEYGMMYRKSMEDRMGMLFFMGNMQMRSFWMKNTYVSLDIIFIDNNLKIVSIQKNAEPLNTRSLPSEGPAQYVLEVPGGLSDRINLQKGDKLIYKDKPAAVQIQTH